jgi:predicted membrane channel-forming protein YqfA (hemolysin III family)
MGSQCIMYISSSHYGETSLKSNEHYNTMDYYAIFAAIQGFAINK